MYFIYPSWPQTCRAATATETKSNRKTVLKASTVILLGILPVPAFMHNAGVAWNFRFPLDGPHFYHILKQNNSSHWFFPNWIHGEKMVELPGNWHWPFLRDGRQFWPRWNRYWRQIYRVSFDLCAISTLDSLKINLSVALGCNEKGTQWYCPLFFFFLCSKLDTRHA